MPKSAEILRLAMSTSGECLPLAHKYPIYMFLREERGANTEPTGLGMERWYVVPHITVLVNLTLVLHSEGRMGWGGVRVVSRLPEKPSLVDQEMENLGVRDVR